PAAKACENGASNAVRVIAVIGPPYTIHTVITGSSASTPSAAQLARYRALAERFLNAKRIAQRSRPTIEPCQMKWISARLNAIAGAVIWNLLLYDPAAFRSRPDLS